MKTPIYLFAINFLLSYSSIAQHSFAPLGAKWHYTVGTLDQMDDVSCVTIECIGDTLIAGDSSNILEVKHLINGEPETVISHEYIKHRNDTTFYYNPYLHDFVMLYNFNAAAGDTITVHASQTNVPPGFFKNSVPMFKYIIQDVDSVFISSEWRKRQKVTPEPDFGGHPNTWRFDSYGDTSNNQIIEGIGATSYFFGWSGNVTVATMGTMLRCYSDSVTTYQNPEWEKACDYTRRYTGLSDNTKESVQVNIYPNPTQQTIHVNSDGLQDATYTVVNAQGKIILTSQSSIIDVSGLSTGFYFLVCQSRNQTSFTRKFSKQ